MRILHAIRGAVGIGLLWAVPWSVAGIVASPLIRNFAHARPPHSILDRLFDGAFIGWYGFLAGLAFSVVLAVAARRRVFQDLTAKRMAALGVVSSALLTIPPMIAMLAGREDGWRPEDPFYLGGSLLLSTGCAVASLLIARRAAAGGRGSISDDGERAEISAGWTAPTHSTRAGVATKVSSLAIASVVVLGACTPPVSVTSAPPPPTSDGGTTPAITVHDLESRLTAFAHDTMMGRAAWSAANVKASDYVAREFARAGLTPAGENGTWFQTVPNQRTNAGAPPPAFPARNVIGILRGSDPTLANTYISITAHNDHNAPSLRPVDHDSLRAFNAVIRPLGADSRLRQPADDEWKKIRFSLDSLRKLRPPRPDSINNGADDDGSGTIALIELAEAYARGAIKPRRSILFVSHTAEERGLIGSAWFTDYPTVPIDSIVAEFDLDMVGRGAAHDIAGGGPTYLEVVGLRRISKEFGDWVAAANAKQKVPFVFDETYDAPGHPLQYYCRADHYSYARYGIPSVSLSRGSHRDYHQVTDEPQYIDYPDYARLTQMTFDASLAVANSSVRPKSDVPKPTDPHVRCRQ